MCHALLNEKMELEKRLEGAEKTLSLAGSKG